MASRFLFGIIGFALAAILFVTTSVLFAWIGPTQAPPNGNASAPLNVSSTDQVKNAGLGMNSLAVFGNAILSGAARYMNFGTTAGSAGYGFRDNSGTMEFKNGTGSWNSFLPSTGIASISFADGTTQTTAASGGALTCVTRTASFGSGGTATVNCAADEVVTGGGYTGAGSSLGCANNYPATNGWTAGKCYNVNYAGQSGTVYARCCK